MNRSNAPNNAQDLQGLSATLWLVWGALLFSLFILASVSLLIPPPPEFEPAPLAAGSLPPILIILGGATIALIPLLRDTRQKMFFEQAERGFEDKDTAASAFFNMSLTTWVFCELIGVFGLVMTYMTYKLAFSLPFVGVAGVLFALFRPNMNALKAAKTS